VFAEDRRPWAGRRPGLAAVWRVTAALCTAGQCHWEEADVAVWHLNTSHWRWYVHVRHRILPSIRPSRCRAHRRNPKAAGPSGTVPIVEHTGIPGHVIWDLMEDRETVTAAAAVAAATRAAAANAATTIAAAARRRPTNAAARGWQTSAATPAATTVATAAATARIAPRGPGIADPVSGIAKRVVAGSVRRVDSFGTARFRRLAKFVAPLPCYRVG
jgi:hypothetical protein